MRGERFLSRFEFISQLRGIFARTDLWHSNRRGLNKKWASRSITKMVFSFPYRIQVDAIKFNTMLLALTYIFGEERGRKRQATPQITTRKANRSWLRHTRRAREWVGGEFFTIQFRPLNFVTFDSGICDVFWFQCAAFDVTLGNNDGSLRLTSEALPPPRRWTWRETRITSELGKWTGARHLLTPRGFECALKPLIDGNTKVANNDA